MNDFSGVDIKQLINKKSIPVFDKKKMGVDSKSDHFAYTLDELRKSIPNIVIAECVTNVSFSQNKFKRQQVLKKKINYVMGLGVYQQLHYDTNRKKRILKPGNIKFKNVFRPYIGQDLTNKSLIVSRTGGVGDIIMIQPNLIHLKEKFPTCKIIFACGPQYQSMIENWDCVDEVLDLPFPMSKLFSSNYHAIFEGVIERCQEAKITNAYRLFTNWLGLNLPDDKLIPIQIPNEERIKECKDILFEWNIMDNPFILMQLRASSPIRTPSPKVWKMIINSITNKGHRVIITDSPAQYKVINEFIKTLDNKELVFNFCEKSKTLDYTIALASLAKLTISTDSSLIHIAASVGTSCLGIYGPFPGEVRLTTYKNCEWVNCKSDCSPCFIHSPMPCRNSYGGHSKCYNNIDMKEFNNKMEKLMKGGE